MATNARKCSTYRTGVMLKTKRKIISVVYGVEYHTSIPNPVCRPFRDLIFNPKSIAILTLHTDNKPSGTNIVLKKHISSIFM
jgi:hypothetical protein